MWSAPFLVCMLLRKRPTTVCFTSSNRIFPFRVALYRNAQHLYIFIYFTSKHRTTRHNAPCPGRIGAGQGTGSDAAIHLDDGIAPLPLQQTFGSSDLLVAAGQIDLPTATGVYRHQQQLRNLGQVRQGRFHRRFGVEYQPGLHPGGADGPPGIS